MSLQVSVVNVENTPVKTEWGSDSVITLRVGIPGYCFLRELIIIDGLSSGSYPLTGANPQFYASKADFDAAVDKYWITTVSGTVPWYSGTKPGFQRTDLGVSAGLHPNQPTGTPVRFTQAYVPSLYLILPAGTSTTTPVRMRIVTVK